MRNESRMLKSANNLVYATINKIVMLVLTFVSRTIFLNVLSADYLGINGLFTDVLTMLSLADLGLGSAMAYSFYKPLAEKDEKQLAALICFYGKIYTCIAFAVALIGIAIVPFLRFIVNTESDVPNLELYYLVFLANTVISYLFVYKSTIISADQRSYLISKYSVWISLIKVVLQIVILYLTRNYLAYISVNLVTTLINNLLVSYKADKLYPFIKKREVLDSNDKKTIFDNIKSVFLYKLSGVVLNGTDNILISTLVGTAAVGLYSNYYIITYNISSFSQLFFNSITASVGNIVVKEDNNKKYETFKVMQMISFWMGGVFSVCVLLLAQEFIILWIGEKYLLPFGTLIAIVSNLYLALCLPPIWAYREATGLFQKTKYIMIITAVINIILSIILGKIYGIGGIIFATFIAKISTYFWYEPNLLFKKYFGKSCKEYYFHHVANLGLMLFATVLLGTILHLVPAKGWVLFGTKTILLFVGMNVVYLIRYVRTPEFCLIMSKMGRIMNKERT